MFMSEHTKFVSQTFLYHIRALPLIHVCDRSTAAIIAPALVSRQPDYAKSVMYAFIGQKLLIYTGSRRQQPAAKVVAHLSSVEALSELHWLPIHWLTKFIRESLTFKAMHNEIPHCLSYLLIPTVLHIFLASFCHLRSRKRQGLKEFKQVSADADGPRDAAEILTTASTSRHRPNVRCACYDERTDA